MVLNIDLAPSLLDLAGIHVPEWMQGESFIPIVKNPFSPGRKSFLYELFKDFPFGGRVPPNKTLRTERYKYIEWQACRKPELYDLLKDPREMNNLMNTIQGKKILPDLKKELEKLKIKYCIM
ncbi:MAG: DUF4976 domain-containing protein [Spirochaetes bacterium]|nr:DUF4976 domain-containing protein [Spirochaetota bacterium]